jgi:tRNA(adenine34) deaminase
MQKALDQAQKAASIGEVPVGAVVVCEGHIVGRGFNLREHYQDPSAHAEFRAILQAARKLKSWRLLGCDVYVSLEPCLMCAGLMHQARIRTCVFAACDPKAGALGSLYQIHQDQRLNHRFDVRSGILADESAAILKSFFRKARTKYAK